MWEPDLRFPSTDEVIAVDPTESVHSATIIKTARWIFPQLGVIPTYGTLAFIISWYLRHDALYDTEKGREAFEATLDIDTVMLDADQLPLLFCVLDRLKATIHITALAHLTVEKLLTCENGHGGE